MEGRGGLVLLSVLYGVWWCLVQRWYFCIELGADVYLNWCYVYIILTWAFFVISSFVLIQFDL